MSMARVIPSEDMEKKAGAGSGMARILPSDDIEKQAMDSAAKNLMIAASLGIGAPIIAESAADVIDSLKDRRAKKKAWAGIVSRYPEFDTPDARDTFDAMYGLSPGTMKHPKFAIPALRQASDYNTGGIPVEMVRALSSIDSNRTKGSRSLAEKIVTGMESGIGISQDMQNLKLREDQFGYAQKQDAIRTETDTKARNLQKDKQDLAKRQHLANLGKMDPDELRRYHDYKEKDNW